MSLNTTLLESSFAQVRDHQTEFTDYFYTTLFTDFPQVKPLFTHTEMDKQAKKLFASLVLVVNNLTHTDTLTDALQGLGARHIKYGVYPEHYPMVGSTLLKSMAFTLKQQWTSEAEEAWNQAYTAIVAIMLEGAEYPPESLSPDLTKPKTKG